MTVKLTPTEPKDDAANKEFHCQAYGRSMRVSACIRQYVDANALNWKHTPCFKCTEGAENRASYSES